MHRRFGAALALLVYQLASYAGSQWPLPTYHIAFRASFVGRKQSSRLAFNLKGSSLQCAYLADDFFVFNIPAHLASHLTKAHDFYRNLRDCSAVSLDWWPCYTAKLRYTSNLASHANTNREIRGSRVSLARRVPTTTSEVRDPRPNAFRRNCSRHPWLWEAH